MLVFHEREQRTLELEFQGTVQKLLETLNINSETVLVVKGDEILTETDTVKDEDHLRLLSVISGG